MQTSIKIISLLVIVLLVQQSTSVTYNDLLLKQIACSAKYRIDECVTNPLSELTYGKVDSNGCALDYYRSMACFTAFSKCVPQNLSDEIPVHCWNCLVQSSADSDVFKLYQDCLNTNSSAYHNIGLGLAMMLVLAMFFM